MGIVNQATLSASLSDVVVRGIFTRDHTGAAKGTSDVPDCEGICERGLSDKMSV